MSDYFDSRPSGKDNIVFEESLRRAEMREIRERLEAKKIKEGENANRNTAKHSAV